MLLVVMGLAVMASFVFWFAFKLKTVMLDGVLYVRGYLKELAIPFMNIASIRYSRLMFPHLTVLQLKTTTDFGDKIIFISKRRIVTPAGSRSTFEELQARIVRAQA